MAERSRSFPAVGRVPERGILTSQASSGGASPPAGSGMKSQKLAYTLFIHTNLLSIRLEISILKFGWSDEGRARSIHP